MNVLVDIGNTRIKWCIDNNQGIGNGHAIEHQYSSFIKKIQQAWEILDTPETLAIASVSKKQIVEQLKQLAKVLWPNVSLVIAKTSPQAFSVINSYPQANKLGIDRWLGLIALRHYYPGNSCIVDCGTAITIDVLNDQGKHLGGVISPGLQTMKHALFQGTENLFRVDQQFSKGLSNNTEAAIYSGTLYAAIGLIEKVVTDIFTCQTIVLTGGDAILLSQHLDFKLIIEPDFILKGLAIYCKGEVEE